MKKITLTLVSALLCTYSTWLLAGPAAPIVFELTQPDGTTFDAIRRGDEYRNWIETPDGRSIVEDNGTWFYAERDSSGKLTATIHAVGSTSAAQLKSIPLHVAPPRDSDAVIPRTIRKIQRTVKNRDLQAPSAMAFPHQQYLLTVLVDYSDIGFTYSDSSFQGRIYGSSGTVRDFFKDNSYGEFTIAAPVENYGSGNDGIIHVTRATAHPNPGDDKNIAQQEAREIVALTDAYINYANYDANGDGMVSADELSIMIILAGYETSYGAPPSPSVWGHAWAFASSLTLDGVGLQPYTMIGERHESHQATIGVMCHELGHLMFGLPDLYDLDDSSAGIGDWGLMGGGEWNYSGGFQGGSPAHLSAWSKVVTNLTIPQDIDSNQSAVVLAKADSNESAKRIWIDKYKLREYFLVENRQKSGYDVGLPGRGMLIWHIDENLGTNADENHKLVDLEEADGLMQLDDNANDGDTGDPFPGSRNKTSFNDSSSPNSRDYAGNATHVAVTNVSAPAATMTADMAPRAGGVGDNVSYFENGNTAGLGFSGNTVWMGMRTQNDTAHTKFDGVDVYVNDPVGATIDIKYYTSMSGGTPSGLIHTQAGFAAGPGWNRLLLATPQDFPVGAERGIVLKIVNNSASYPATFTPSDNGSGRAYLDNDGNGTFYSICPSFCGDFNLAVLFSSEEPAFQINAGLNDAWYYQVTTGQGFFITVFPQLGYVSLSWFTYDTVRPGAGVTANLGEPGHRWLNAVGPFSGNQAVLDVSYATGGVFDSPTLVEEVSDGTITLTFSDCNNGTVEYDIPSIGRQGTVPIQRVVSDNITLCETLSQQPVTMQKSSPQGTGNLTALQPGNPAAKVEALALTTMNPGLNDAWYYQVTTGQGFFINVFPVLGYVTLSWFTYDTVRPPANVTADLGEPGHRWLNALGQINGNRAVMDVSYATGGLFDSPTPTEEINDGTITLTFDDCNTGTVEYDIPSIGQTGTVPIKRVANDNIALCESLITP